MRYSNDELNDIYERTSGYCHLCHRKLAFTNYGVPGARGAWEIEHSNPQARGGTSLRRNLYAACIPCNRSKGCRSTKSVRCQNGVRRAPLSIQQSKERKRSRPLQAVWRVVQSGPLSLDLSER